MTRATVFDAGFSQLTTAFHAGARAVLLNYLVPKDVLGALARERITGLTAVPPLYIQLAQLAGAGGRTPIYLRTSAGASVPRYIFRLILGMTTAWPTVNKL